MHSGFEVWRLLGSLFFAEDLDMVLRNHSLVWFSVWQTGALGLQQGRPGEGGAQVGSAGDGSNFTSVCQLYEPKHMGSSLNLGP